MSRAWGAVIAIGVALVVLYACNSSAREPAAVSPAPTCRDVLASVIQLERTDGSSDVNDEVAWMATQCPAEQEIFVGYVSGRSSAAVAGPRACEELTSYIPEEAIDLLYADGFCTSTANVPQDVPTDRSDSPGDGLSWDRAAAHAGTAQRVCGPLAGSANVDGALFLNLGVDFPSNSRFQIILWNPGQVDPISYGSTVCASGPISIYNGVAQIEFADYWELEVEGW